MKFPAETKELIQDGQKELTEHEYIKVCVALSEFAYTIYLQRPLVPSEEIEFCHLPPTRKPDSIENSALLTIGIKSRSSTRHNIQSVHVALSELTHSNYLQHLMADKLLCHLTCEFLVEEH